MVLMANEMINKPDFIDNLDGNSLLKALKKVLEFDEDDSSGGYRQEASIDEARIATAYFSPEGFSRIAPLIKNISSIKLMLWSDPTADYERWQRKVDESEQRFIGKKFREGLKQQEEALRTERNHIPFSKTSRSALKQLVESLRAGNMQVRRYENIYL